MAWNKIDTTFWLHKKTMKVAYELGIHPMQAAGHIGALWAWALDSAEDGQLPEQDIMIATAAHWDGKPEHFVQALVLAGYIDDDYDGHRTLHKWGEWAGAIVRRREDDRKRMKKFREAQAERRKQGYAGPPPPDPRHYAN